MELQGQGLGFKVSVILWVILCLPLWGFGLLGFGVWGLGSGVWGLGRWAGEGLGFIVAGACRLWGLQGFVLSRAVRAYRERAL